MKAAVPPRTFDPAAVEARILRMWEEGGHFGASAGDVEGGGDPYVIVIPPPNVTDVLHMGHGLNNTIQDVLVRWRRMQGRVALWVPGTDHAGIATQNVVERRLAAEGRTRHDLGREAFVERVWDYVEVIGDRILDQLKAIGCSCDWTRTRFTLDEGLSRAVREIFVGLYERDLVYRGERIINWCPRCLTALSNEEAEGAEAEGSLWHIRYPLVSGHGEAAAAGPEAGAEAIDRLPDGRWHLTVSTTRPETMLGRHRGGREPRRSPLRLPSSAASAHLPLTGRVIPHRRRPHVSAEFGTGMVKVTPAHDPNDFEIAARTGLAVLDVMTERAVMNENAPAAFRGLDRFDARRAVVAALEGEGLLAGRDRHLHAVPRCYRCETVVEPRLSEQWFVRVKPLAEPALAASRDGTVTFAPGRWTRVYENWMENIRDWCISRQLWWGHRIPVWYCGDCGAVMACREDPSTCAGVRRVGARTGPPTCWTPGSRRGCGRSRSSAGPRRPRISGPSTRATHSRPRPEIIFFWVARMIMAPGTGPWAARPSRACTCTAPCAMPRAARCPSRWATGSTRSRWSNSTGADALRFTLLAVAGVGADIPPRPRGPRVDLRPGRNFVNKLWNAGRFALMSLGDDPIRPLAEVKDDLELEDRWILSPPAARHPARGRAVGGVSHAGRRRGAARPSSAASSPTGTWSRSSTGCAPAAPDARPPARCWPTFSTESVVSSTPWSPS